MSTNDVDPKELLGGSWEKIEGKFLFGSNTSYTLGREGGEVEHTLTSSEMPSHEHDSLYWTGNTECPISLNGGNSVPHSAGYRLSWA
jgi:microcystin-dependent protein